MKKLLLLTLFLSANLWSADYTMVEWMKSNCPVCQLMPGDDLRVPYAAGTLQLRVNQVQKKRIRFGFLRVQDQNGTFRIFYNADRNPNGRNEDAKLLCSGLGPGWKPSEVSYSVVYKTNVPNSAPSPDYETISILECRKGFNLNLPTLPGPTFNIPISVNDKDRESGKNETQKQSGSTVSPQSTSPR